GPVTLALYKVPHHAGKLLLADQWTDHGAFVAGSAQLHDVGHVRDSFDDPLVDAALSEDARPAHTGLPRVDEGAERSHRDGQVEVGVVEDHDRGFAAQVEGDLVKVA